MDEGTVTLILTAMKVVTVALGALIIYLGTKAYRASRRAPLLWLTVGMGIMTLGAVAEGLATMGGLELGQSHIIEGVVTLVGFGVLVYSLYA